MGAKGCHVFSFWVKLPFLLVIPLCLWWRPQGLFFCSRAFFTDQITALTFGQRWRPKQTEMPKLRFLAGHWWPVIHTFSLYTLISLGAAARLVLKKAHSPCKLFTLVYPGSFSFTDFLVLSAFWLLGILPNLCLLVTLLLFFRTFGFFSFKKYYFV